MAYTAFSMDVYGKHCLSPEEIVRIVKELPAPMYGHVHLSERWYGPSKMFQSQTSREMRKYLSRKDISAILDSVFLTYGADERSHKGFVYSHMTSDTSRRVNDAALDIYGKTSLARTLKKRKLGNLVSAASVWVENAEEGNLDCRVFKYAEILVRNLDTSRRNQYHLILNDYHGKYSLATIPQFLDGLDSLITKNCRAEQ